MLTVLEALPQRGGGGSLAGGAGSGGPAGSGGGDPDLGVVVLVGGVGAQAVGEGPGGRGHDDLLLFLLLGAVRVVDGVAIAVAELLGQDPREFLQVETAGGF